MSSQKVLGRLREIVKPSDLFEKVVSEYIADTHEDVRCLQSLAAVGDLEQIKCVAHKLKGGFQLLNAFTLWELCRELEERLDFLSSDMVISRCRKVGEEWLLLKSDVIRAIKTNDS